MLSILFGFVVGTALGLTGGGGGVFAVPLLVYGQGLSARDAISVSLVSVGAAALAGFCGRLRNGDVELRPGFLFAAAGIIGAPFGTTLAVRLPDALLIVLLSLLMLTIAVRMWHGRPGPPSLPTAVPETPGQLPQNQCRDSAADEAMIAPPLGSAERKTATNASADVECQVTLPTAACQRNDFGQLLLTTRCARLLLTVGLGAGVLSGLFGVGGGFLIVPALVEFSGMPIRRAVGTSLMVIFLVSLSGIATRFYSGELPPLNAVSWFLPGCLGGLWIGQTSSRRLPQKTLKRIFATAILAVAVFMLLKNALA